VELIRENNSARDRFCSGDQHVKPGYHRQKQGSKIWGIEPIALSINDIHLTPDEPNGLHPKHIAREKAGLEQHLC